MSIASYTSDGEQEVQNQPGRAHAGVAMAAFEAGAEVCLLNPQAFHTPLWTLASLIGAYFQQGAVGFTCDLSPPLSDGPPLACSNVDQFVVQLENSSAWRLYDNPDGYKLPRDASGPFARKELGAPVLELLLAAGDVLYIPRGVIYQASMLEQKQHSLRMTCNVSVADV